MKRKLRMAVASVLAVASLAMSAGAASYDNCAERLSDLGLFRGTESGYELDRAPTRAEAGVMLVRKKRHRHLSIQHRLPIWKAGSSPISSICMIMV